MLLKLYTDRERLRLLNSVQELATSDLFDMFTQSIKGTLMQIWKSPYMFVFI